MARRTLALLFLLLLAAAPALAQTATPYAGLQTRDIRALSPEQVDDLLNGRGMGLALSAELNGWPGPQHVLELADRLNLTPEQRRETEALRTAHRAAAARIGQDIVEAERALDRAFRERSITPARLAELTERIGALQATLRAEHLATHIRQTALLSAAQVARYDVLRGYAQGSPGGSAPAEPQRHRHRH
jgi:Spy/CpxP family protein refolding chaperone